MHKIQQTRPCHNSFDYSNAINIINFWKNLFYEIEYEIRVEELEINFSLEENLYKAFDCTELHQVLVNTFVEVGGKNL